MNKYILKAFIILITICIFLYGFSSSYFSNNITNISYVTGIGIDLSEDKKHPRITFEFIDSSQFSQDGSSSQSNPILESITSYSISSALNVLNSYIGNEANLSHCKIIVFSEEIAKQGISSEVTELMNNIQIRPSTNIVISKCSAFDYMTNTTSALDKVLTKYYDIFPNSSVYTGYTSNITIGKFYNNLIDNNSGNIAILGGVNSLSSNYKSENSKNEDLSSENQSSNNQKNINASQIYSGEAPIKGDRGAEDIGIAVFKEDKYIGELSALESLCHSILIDEVDNFVITLDNNEFYDHCVDLSLFNNTSKSITIDITNNTPIININLQLKGRVLGLKESNEIAEDLDLDTLSIASSKYLKYIITNYLNKTVSEYKCDINQLHYYVRKNFLTTQDLNNFNWSEKYKTAKFNVTVDSTISFNLFGNET